MSIHDKLAAVADELHLSGFGSELTEGLKRVAATIADEVHVLAGGASADVGAKIEDLVKAEVAKFQPTLDGIAAELNKQTLARIEQLATGLQTSLDDRVKTLFNELLAKAAASEGAKPLDPVAVAAAADPTAAPAAANPPAAAAPIAANPAAAPAA